MSRPTKVIFRLALALGFMLVPVAFPAAAAPAEHPVHHQQLTCQSDGTGTVCMESHSLVNEVFTPSGGGALTAHDRFEMSFYDGDGQVLGTYSSDYRSQQIWVEGEVKVHVFHLVRSSPTCTDAIDLVYANGKYLIQDRTSTCA